MSSALIYSELVGLMFWALLYFKFVTLEVSVIVNSTGLLIAGQVVLDFGLDPICFDQLSPP